MNSTGRVVRVLGVLLLLAAGLTFGPAPDAGAQAGVVNTCPASDISVALYGGSVAEGLVAGSRFLDQDPGFCVQVIPEADWAAMTIAEFRLFNVLWIGNDNCGGFDPADFDTAAATVTTWEAAIDARSVMIAGGDYDFHYNGDQDNAIAVTQALVQTVGGGAAPGLVLQAGCYAVNGAPWFQNIGGSFTGLSHAGVSNGDPGPTDVVLTHEFNASNGFDSTSYNFGASCHDGIAIDPAAPVANYQLQTLFNFRGAPCFVFSDSAVAPTFFQDIGDTVFCDNDGNGVPGTGEGIAGVTVALTASDGTTTTASTDAGGLYLFADQVVGTYTVSIDTATLPAACNVLSVDPDGGDDAMSTLTTAVTATTNLDQDFGFVAPAGDPTPTPEPTPAPVIPPAPTPAPVIAAPTGPLLPPPFNEMTDIEQNFNVPIPNSDDVLGNVAEAPAVQGPTAAELAFTGAETTVIAFFGLALLAFGATACGVGRTLRRDR